MRSAERRAIFYGLVIVGGFVAIDISITNSAAISGSYALGAIVAGVLVGFRPALLVGVVAALLAVASGAWNDDFGAGGYYARLFVSAATVLLALGAGRLREDNENQVARQRLLGAVAGLPEPGETLDETLARVVELLVPRYAAFAAVEGGFASEQVRLASRGTEPVDRAAIETRLVARGRDIGALHIAGGRAGSEDREFLHILSGRVALALDNAGLSQELFSAEQRLQAILENLGEAVTVQDRSGRLVFANRVAADLLGADSVEDLLATPPGDLVSRFTTVREDGRPLEPGDLPGRAVLEGRTSQPLLVRTRSVATGEERWRLTKSTPVRGVGGDVVLAVNVIEDVTESKRAEFAQRLLSDASALLASSLDHASTLQRVAELAVPSLADWCSVTIPSGELFEQVAVAYRDPKVLDFAAGYAERWPARVDAPTGSAAVLRSGQPQLVTDVTDELLDAAPLPAAQREELRRLGMCSIIIVPMATPERTVGVLSLVSTESGRRFGNFDLELALELGRRAAAAIENARLYSQLEHVASTLKRSLLPPELPDVPGWEFESLYLPAGGETEVGGDFYDVFPTAAGWMAVMGDVVGRGPEAASLTAMARYTLRTAGALVGTPAMGLARLNENLRERDEMALCTAAVMLLREGTSEASLVCAGHPLPFLVRGGQPQQIGRIGPLLGAFDQAHWLPAAIALEPGDVVVLYTDGVTDARGPGARFGEERLAEALRGAGSAADAVERIRAALHEFAGGEQDDDTAVLALQKL